VRKIPRLATVGATAALAVALGACSGSPAPPSSPPAGAPAAAPTSAAPGAPAADDGVTTPAEVFGPGCASLPQGDAPGSAARTADQPVVTAIATNPQLTTLVSAIGAVPGLADALNAQKAITLFAPSNAAFDQAKATMGDQAFTELLADPQQLATLLSYYVVPRRYDAAGLVAAGRTTELAGGEVTIGGAAAAPTVTSGDGTQAAVVCGNLPTANATVFVVDRVLRPAG
jgi:uncharacterized surface protein with fasciclin (FAS1) repeats